MFSMVTVALLVISSIIYVITKRRRNIWKEKGILHVKPWPLVGNFGSTILGRNSVADLINNFYTTFPVERYFGIHQFTDPVVVIRDLELIKRITVKEFDKFPQHQALVPEDIDPLMGKILFNMPGDEKWHKMRATVSPTFTSSKMRIMFGLMTERATKFMEYLQKKDTKCLEVKDIFSKFTNDVIASCAFGVSCNSLEDPGNEFYSMGKSAASSTVWMMIKCFLYALMPNVMKVLKITLLPPTVNEFFRSVIKDTLRSRKENGLIRHDLIHLLMEARKSGAGKKFDDPLDPVISHTQSWELTEEDITSQALNIYFAAFDTSSTTMSFAAYELAINVEVQERLREEIDDVLKEMSSVSYERLTGMKYMDLVVLETLRKWPPVPFTNRSATKPFTIPRVLPWEKDVEFDSGTSIFIPIYSIHRNSKYYPNPGNFDPERFNEERKHNLTPFSYIPFGDGPRNCIGSRFALLEIKLVLFHILSKFEIVAVEKTPMPIVLEKNMFLVADKGWWLGLKPRT